MKLKSLILGSVAAAGLSTAGYAADLGVLTSLDVCDALGLSGLTISSDTNCLQISGEVKYEFQWGDYRGDWRNAGILGTLNSRNVMDDNQSVATPAQDGLYQIRNAAGATVAVVGRTTPPTVANGGLVAGQTAVQIVAPVAAVPAGQNEDWESQIDAWVKFVGTADSDFGPAKAVIKILEVQEARVQNETAMPGDDAKAVTFDEAYVSVGDTTVIMAGKKGSIANFGDDEPFNYLGLFGSDWADKGVKWDIDLAGGWNMGDLDTGGHVIQVVSDLGNGISAGIGLENLNDTAVPTSAGTLVGVLSYSGEGITAHITGLAGGLLDGTVEGYAFHTGFTGTFDQFKLRGAFAAAYDVAAATTAWNGLLSASATFDMFTIALSGEALGGTGLNTDYGIGGSIGATVTEGVSINLGAKWFDSNNAGGADGYQVAAQLVAAVTETIKLTGEVGVYGNTTASTSDFYGAAELAWAPGGGFTSSIKGEAHQNGAYKVTFKAAKAFQ